MQAMEDLYRKHAGAIRAYALRSASRADVADEITQDTFIRAFRAIGRFRGGSSFRTWLFSIAVNTTRTHMKRLNRHEPTPFDEALITEKSPEPESLGWLRRRLLNALATLPEGYREVVVMHDVLEMPHEEIARARRCTIGTSKSQLHKARARLRTILGGADV